MSDEFPPLIGKYKVSGIVAKGGMGVVYKAMHPSLKRYVVIKKMTARGKSGNAERFKKEAQILLDLQSPYIVHLFDYFTEAGFRYMVEELVDGAAVDTLIKKQTCLPVPVAMLIMQDSCYALKYAHSKNIVHRDIKPGNILISKRGEIKLADFGIASDISEGEDNITQSGVALGTPAYMPPEQFEDSTKVDNRADIYALGIMLYEMITGTKPYQYTNNSLGEMLKTVKKGKYIKPRSIDKTIPPVVSGLIHKMIRPKAKQRFQSIDGVLKVVKRYLKHYDAHEIRVQLAKSVISTKIYDFPDIQPKDKRKQFVKKIIFIAAGVIALFTAAWTTGLIQRTILAKWCSPVSLEVEMPKSLSQVMDLPINVFFFQNDNDELPEVRGTQRTLTLEGSRPSEKFISLFKRGDAGKGDISGANQTYTMRTVFLKKGDYRVKVVVGPYVWWKSFSVDEKDCLVECEFLKNMKRQVSITTYAFDRETNLDISDKVRFNILYNDEWVPISSVDPKKIVSGTVWKIAAVADGYVDEYFSLLIDWFQDDLTISASLEKK